MKPSPGRALVGSQIWIEPGDTPERIRDLCRKARESGIGWLRVFLMWPWIEHKPGVWDWEIFDTVFDAAAENGILIKATLTANSGPWHIGTPSLLHSFTTFLSPEARAAALTYVRHCVTRYKDHPALGQWILWNEPDGSHAGTFATPESLAFWQDMLRDEFGGDIARLNQRWRTGYADFSDVPFPADILHLAFKEWNNWASYGPRLVEWRFKGAWLNREIGLVRDVVREIDTRTDLCMNPTAVHTNGAAGATDFSGMGEMVDVLGASYHPAWMFTFAARAEFPALMHSGLRLQRARPGVSRVEVTEVQTGNTLQSSNRPCNAEPDELARFYLASYAAGAESVTGWCLNARSTDFEAGDWALLDNVDQPSARSRMMARVASVMDDVLSQTGPWRAAPAIAFVISDPRAHALEWIEANVARTPVPGRMPDDGAHGAALLASALMGMGLATDLIRWTELPENGAGRVLVASHVGVMDADDAARLNSFVSSGGHLLIDATTGHKTPDAALWRPWPGGLADRFGFHTADLESDPKGWAVASGGNPAANFLSARCMPRLSGDWRRVGDMQFVCDGTAFALTRSLGAGLITLCRGVLGPNLVHRPETAPMINALLSLVCAPILPDIRYVQPGPGMWSAPIDTDAGRLILLIAPPQAARGTTRVSLIAPAGSYRDLWSGQETGRNDIGEVDLVMPEGVAILCRIGD